MAWFKVDDTFHSSRKVKAIPRAQRLSVIGLWTLAGTWSAQEEQDGNVPAYIVDDLAGEKSAAWLVKVGLWDETADGFRFHDWEDYQPTKAQLDAKRVSKSEAGRLGGLKSGESRRKQTDSTDEAQPKHNASSTLNPVPSRPVPDLTRTTSHSQSHQPTAHANETDGLDIGRVRTAISRHLGILDVPSVAELEALAADLIARAPKKVRSREAYIEGCDGESVRAAWDRVQSIRASIAASLGAVA